jgi:hypothetical protein
MRRPAGALDHHRSGVSGRNWFPMARNVKLTVSNQRALLRAARVSD